MLNGYVVGVTCWRDAVTATEISFIYFQDCSASFKPREISFQLRPAEKSKHCKGAVQRVRCNSLQVEYSCNKEVARLEMKVPGTAIACIYFCVNMMSHS